MHFIEQVHQAGRNDLALSQWRLRRLLPRPAHSFHGPGEGVQADQRLRARTGWAMRRTRSCSGSMARRFSRRKDLEAHFKRLEEASRRATIACWASSSTCFRIQELAGAGLIFWHPKGGMVRKPMEDWMREECIRRGYVWSLPRTSCGASCGRSAGTRASTRRICITPMELDDAEYRLKPMNCPGHILIYKNTPEQLSRSAAALCGIRQRLSLRALGHHARPAARARLYAGRCAYLLHAGAD